MADDTLFGDVRQRAFKIMPKDALQRAGQGLSVKSPSMMAMRWKIVDALAPRVQRHLRPSG